MLSGAFCLRLVHGRGSWQLSTWWDVCVCFGGYLYIGVCHPSGVEQLFYQQASESFPGVTKTSRYLHLLSQRMNKWDCFHIKLCHCGVTDR